MAYKRNNNFREAVNNAISGIIHSIKTQINIKIQFFIAILILLLSLFFNFSKAELVCLCITISLVIVAELMNTAIENVVDLYIDVYHENAKIAKDVGAGAVVIASINAIVVGYILFIDKISNTTESLLNKINNTPLNVSFIAMMITLIIVVIMKAKFGRGTPLHGGMPSGHSAIAFAILMAIWLISRDFTIFVLSGILSFMVAQSRVEGNIHSKVEVIAGGFVGMLITLLIHELVVYGIK